jgi:hypothetical protein
MYLSPDLAVPTSLAPSVAQSLAMALGRIEEDDDVTAVSQASRAGSRRRTAWTRRTNLDRRCPAGPGEAYSATPTCG